MLKHRNPLQKSPCPVVICPYLCSSVRPASGGRDPNLRRPEPCCLATRAKPTHALTPKQTRPDPDSPAIGLRVTAKTNNIQSVRSRIHSPNLRRKDNNSVATAASVAVRRPTPDSIQHDTEDSCNFDIRGRATANNPAPRQLPPVGWHYLSNTTCLIRPHVFSTASLV